MVLLWVLFNVVVALVVALVLVDRRHAAELAATGTDRYGHWRRARRMALVYTAVAAMAAGLYLLQGKGYAVAGPLLLFGGPGLVALRAASRRARRVSGSGAP